MSAEAASPPPLGTSRMRIADTLGSGFAALRRRGMRSVLSALGVSIGIAALVAVLGLSESSRAKLSDELDALGTNILQVSAAQGFGAGDAALEPDAVPRVRGIRAVETATGVATSDAKVVRNRWMSTTETRGVTLVATDEFLLSTLSGHIAQGGWPGAAWNGVPVVVIGATTAQRLNISSVADGPILTVNGRAITIVGILEPLTLAPSLDSTVMISNATASDILGKDLVPAIIFVRSNPALMDAVQTVLPETVEPLTPEETEISRPTDALEAKAAADTTFTALFAGLGAVSLLVGGIGIANVMIISVIERRGEIGLRRSIGATRSHIRRQFLAEAVALAIAGGVAGVALGSLATLVFAKVQHWKPVIPPVAIGLSFAAAIVVGVIAGIYPASRAARLSPTEALRGGT